MRRTAAITGTLVMATAMSTLVGVGTAAASPTTDGCRSGFVGHTLTDWADLGYPNAPRAVDDPANGGNGDGYACGRQLGGGTSKKTPSGKVLYEFYDNNLPPAG